jgi:hypothetical protein
MKKIRICKNGHLVDKENSYLEDRITHIQKRCKKCRLNKVNKCNSKPERMEKIRIYWRGHIKKNPRDKKKMLESVRKWSSKNPEKVKAHQLVHKALKAKILKRLPCRVCKEKKTDGHHPDYLKPLEVIWLCRLHHKEQHRKERLLRPPNPLHQQAQADNA